MKTLRWLAPLLLLPLAACGGSDDEVLVIDAREIAAQLESRIQESTGVRTQVTCRNDGDQPFVRMIIPCVVRKDGKVVSISSSTVKRIDDAEGAKLPLTIDLDTGVVATRQIEAAAERRFQRKYGPLLVDCPNLVRSDRRRIDFVCPVISSSARQAVRVSGRSSGDLRLEIGRVTRR